MLLFSEDAWNQKILLLHFFNLLILVCACLGFGQQILAETHTHIQLWSADLTSSWQSAASQQHAPAWSNSHSSLFVYSKTQYCEKEKNQKHSVIYCCDVGPQHRPGSSSCQPSSAVGQRPHPTIVYCRCMNLWYIYITWNCICLKHHWQTDCGISSSDNKLQCVYTVYKKKLKLSKQHTDTSNQI